MDSPADAMLPGLARLRKRPPQQCLNQLYGQARKGRQEDVDHNLKHLTVRRLAIGEVATEHGEREEFEQSVTNIFNYVRLSVYDSQLAWVITEKVINAAWPYRKDYIGHPKDFGRFLIRLTQQVTHKVKEQLNITDEPTDPTLDGLAEHHHHHHN